MLIGSSRIGLRTKQFVNANRLIGLTGHHTRDIDIEEDIDKGGEKE